MSYDTVLFYKLDQPNSEGEDEVEIECSIEWDGEPETPPITSGPPDAWDPGDPGYFEVSKITVTEDYPEIKLNKGDVITIDQVKETEDQIEEMIMEDIAGEEPDYDDFDDYYDDPAHDYLYEGPAGW